MADPITDNKQAIESEAATAPASRRTWWQNPFIMLALSVAIGLLGWWAWHAGVDKRAVTAGVVLAGLLSNAFAWLLGIIALVPVIGPLLVKVLAGSLIWIINAVGYLLSYVAIRRGYSKDVLTYRGLTFALIVGIIIGYLLGKLF